MKNKQETLFNSNPHHAIKYDPLYIIQDGQRVHLNASQIFDANKYDQFIGVTYSTSSEFINKYLTKFDNVQLVLGTNGTKNDNQIYNSFSGVNQAVFDKLKNILKHKMTNLYQSLDNYAKKLLQEKDFILYTPLTAVIHSKFYLMNNSKNGNNRIILGSANLSKRAFHPKIKQFENLLILDNNSIFNSYRDYFTNELKPNTSPYFPMELNQVTKKKITNKVKGKEKQKIANVSVLTPSEEKQAEQAGFVDTAKQLKHKVSLGLIVPKDLNEMKRLDTKVRTADEIDKHNEKVNHTVLNLQTSIINPRTKKPQIKPVPSLKRAYKKNVHIEVTKNVGSDVAKRNAHIIDVPSQRIKNKSGLYIVQGDHKAIPFGKTASIGEIRHDLEGLRDLRNNYDEFAIDESDRDFSRIMEAIFYSFEAPFLNDVREKVIPQIEGQDIPQFLFIGGQGGSGKSSLLRIIIKLLGVYNSDEPQLYSEIIPEGVSRKKSETIKQIMAWINSEDVAPIITDEVPQTFFKNPNYGNNMIVDETNMFDTNPGKKFPVFIGTTNSSNYSLPDRARRRSYYLACNNVFNTTYRQQSGIAYRKVFNELDSNLFNDFCIRFSNYLYTEPDSFWTQYSNNGVTSNGLYDFLRVTRLIFHHYYDICKLPIPKWFPHQRFSDAQESGRIEWKKLYEAHPKWFTSNKEDHKAMFFDINKLNKNSGVRYGIKPSQIYRNDLSSKVVKGTKNGMQIEIKKVPFFKWIGINPRGIKKLFFSLF